jgi:hypothetical protein
MLIYEKYSLLYSTSISSRENIRGLTLKHSTNSPVKSAEMCRFGQSNYLDKEEISRAKITYQNCSGSKLHSLVNAFLVISSTKSFHLSCFMDHSICCGKYLFRNLALVQFWLAENQGLESIMASCPLTNCKMHSPGASETNANEQIRKLPKTLMQNLF